MKKTILTSLVLFALFLTSCSGISIGSTSSKSQTNNTSSTANQLIVGTMNLEDTDLAVTADQAGDLLLYWQVYKEISTSSTSAQEERDGLVAQIQETMTTEQLDAIKEMNLGSNEMTMQGAPNSANASGSIKTDSGSFSPPAGAEMGMSGPPDGGGMPMDGGGGPQPQGSSSSSGNVQQTSSSVSSSTPLDTLIELLGSKVNA